MRMRAILAAALLAAVQMAGPAAAQDVRNGAAFRDWTVACEAVAIGQTDCVLGQVLTEATSGGLIAEVSLAPRPAPVDTEATEPRIVLIVRVPVGVLVFVPPQANVDGGDPFTLAWQSCDARFCAATRVLEAETVAALRSGIALRLGYRRSDAETPVVFDVSLLGVTAGLDALIEAGDP